MDTFQQLGAEIEELWLEKNYNEEELPSIAADALKRADIPSKISGWDVLEWSLNQTELPPQRDLAGRFGDPPITIHSGPRFHIDVYFWFDGTTTIHQHSFCGAFQVLMGSSIHSWYEWELREAVNFFCEVGDLTLKVCELLEIGDVQEIRAGKQYIHSLFHLDQPSATIVVRTDRSPLYLPQFDYYKPSLAVGPFFEQPTVTKKLQTLTALFLAKRSDADEQAARWLERSDAHTAFLILKQIRSLLRSDPMSELFNLESPKTRFESFLDIAVQRHGPAGEAFRPVFDHLDVLDELVRRRSYVTNPEHRFFLALILNVQGRERIFALIRRRFPDSDPVEKVLDWVFDLAGTRVVGADKSNALGIPNFGDAEMFVLENLLLDRSDADIADLYARDHPDEGGVTAASAIAKLRDAPMFGPLLVP